MKISLKKFLLDHKVDISKFKAELTNPASRHTYFSYNDWVADVRPHRALINCFTWNKTTYRPPDTSWCQLDTMWQELTARTDADQLDIRLPQHIHTTLLKDNTCTSD